jgi:hypothetical protein
MAVLVALAVVIVGHLPRGRAAQERRPAAVVAAGPVQLAGLGSSAAGQLDKANGITGPASPWAGNLRLPVTGEHPAWLRSATDRAKPARARRRAGSGYLFIRIIGVGGGSVVQLSGW